MTKLVRKLKQMAKKRAHRKNVQRRKIDRAQKELEMQKVEKEETFEDEVDKEMARLNGEVPAGAHDSDDDDNGDGVNKAVTRAVRILGDLVLDAPVKKNKKQVSRKQAKRHAKMVERGTAINEQLSKKWDHKKRRVKVRAQVRNEQLHN